MVKVDLVCCILGKGVPFVPVAMQHGATEDVLLWQKCALYANITFVFTTVRGRLPCGKMVRIFKSVFVPGLQYLLRTICFQIYLSDVYGNSGIIYSGSPPSLMVLLV